MLGIRAHSAYNATKHFCFLTQHFPNEPFGQRPEDEVQRAVDSLSNYSSCSVVEQA